MSSLSPSQGIPPERRRGVNSSWVMSQPAERRWKLEAVGGTWKCFSASSRLSIMLWICSEPVGDAGIHSILMTTSSSSSSSDTQLSTLTSDHVIRPSPAAAHLSAQLHQIITPLVINVPTSWENISRASRDAPPPLLKLLTLSQHSFPVSIVSFQYARCPHWHANFTDMLTLASCFVIVQTFPLSMLTSSNPSDTSWSSVSEYSRRRQKPKNSFHNCVITSSHANCEEASVKWWTHLF